MKVRYANFIPQNNYSYGRTTVTPYTDIKPKNKNKYILEENNDKANIYTMTMRNSIVS